MYDNDIGYRTPEEFARWSERCPIERLSRRLGVPTAAGSRDAVAPDGRSGSDDSAVAWIEQLRSEIAAELDEAVRFAKASPVPDPSQMSGSVYA